MNSLVKNLVGIVFMRGGPQSLPGSWSFTIVMVMAYLLQIFITGQQLEDVNATAKSLLSISLQILVLSGLLYWRRHMERFAQTLSAFAGVGVIFNTIIWILLLQSGPTTSLLALTWFAVFIWSLFVDAHIYRNSLSVNLSSGMLISVLTLAANYLLIETLFLT